MDIPSIPTGLLEISAEEERVPVAIVHAFCLWGHSVCVKREVRLPPGDPSFCSHVIKPLRTAVCISFDVGPGASVSVRLWEGVEDTSCWNTCEGFSFRPLQRGVGLISDHIKVCLRKPEEQRTSADLIVPTFWKRDTSTSRASDLRFKSP